MSSSRAKIATDVTRILDAAKFPNVLWGWMALNLIQKDVHFSQIDFVIPDEILTPQSTPWLQTDSPNAWILSVIKWGKIAFSTI
ncbi:hypothetical protein BDW59DRAFT_163057 [Aspergillus cavernicola]|uniref:Uncharacterized protein n=1 Tax=Aspergillus cavernicola TaxID=176166 RepID=A0ABR4I7G4_9EURO